MDNYDKMQDELKTMQNYGYETALQYTEEETERALISFYNNLL